MKNSIIRHPKRHPLIIVHRWQIEACDGDVCAAALLSFFEYWHNIKLDQARKAAESNDIAEKHGDKRVQDETLYQFHNEDELEAGIMIYKRVRIGEAIKLLIGKNFVSVHKNPNARYKFDRTRYFLFNSRMVQAWIDSNYPPIDGDSQDSNDASYIFEGRSFKNESSNAKNVARSDENGEPSSETEGRLLNNGASYTENPSEVSTESSDSTTEDTPAALPSAKADAVVENIRSLSGTPSNTNEKPAAQMSLREILATLLSQPADAAEKLATRFQEIAGEKHQLDCPDEIAARVVARFSIATLDEIAVKRLIGPDHAEIGLDTPIGGEEGKSLRADVDELRWQIFAWPSHRAEVEAYYARKKEKPRLTGAFLTKWHEEKPPPRGWVAQLIDEAKHALRSETTARQQVQADAAWAELSPGQQRALDEEVFACVVVSGMAGSVDANKARVKRQLLNDSQFLAGLEDAEPTPQIEAAKMARELESPKPASAYSPNRVELEKMAFHAQKLAHNVRSGQYDLDGAEDDAIGRLFYGPAAAGYLRGMIETLLNASDEVKAA